MGTEHFTVDSYWKRENEKQKTERSNGAEVNDGK
jgi:hypothetical protein